jgi:hypothetical protein
VVQPDGQLAPRYFAAPAANMELQCLEAAPASAERYWKMKSSRVAVTERKDDGARWDISVVRVQERFRQ